MNSTIIAAIIGAVVHLATYVMTRFGFNPSEDTGEKSEQSIGIFVSNISITLATVDDCISLGLSENDAVNFIAMEASSHPEMFSASFKSMPLLFESHTLILSWEKSAATIERVLTREFAYAEYERWSECLALYRRASRLPYRGKDGADRLIVSTEAKRTFALYRTLTEGVNKFLGQSESAPPDGLQSLSEFQSLIDEAEDAILEGDLGTGIVRLEALLSAIHKIILGSAPQEIGPIERTITEPLKLPEKSSEVPLVLVADDMVAYTEMFKALLEEEGCDVVATTDATAAMTSLIERDFDLVITDIRMPVVDGIELGRVVKASRPKTKVLLITAYPVNIPSILDGFVPDAILSKVALPSEITDTIHRLVGT